MKTEQLVSPDKISIVEFRSGDCWVRLALSLANEFIGGELVRFVRDAKTSIEGADNLSSTYSDVNWLSGIASGALYAFRTLRIPRQCVVLTELSGRLRASDMAMLANGSAIAIAELADKSLPSLATEGWCTQSKLADHHSRASSHQSMDDNAVSHLTEQFVDLLAASKLDDRERIIAQFEKTVHHKLDNLDKSAAQLVEQRFAAAQTKGENAESKEAGT